jgi:hypothetical protein
LAFGANIGIARHMILMLSFPLLTLPGITLHHILLNLPTYCLTAVTAINQFLC